MAPYNAPPNREAIADELNNRQVFDFEYVPQEYDLIEFNGLQYRHKYQFLQGSWTFVTQSLMSVSIIEHRSGRIK
ncbi:hypothetical protein [Zeaxanthinibacter enoshimensis]|uniref:hypothetical protein n=1 Tax=Zeaxanthinibacter enoshimensis TaxID=392009 RepID=UPI00356A6D75